MTDERDAWIELPPRNESGFRYHGVVTNMGRLIAAHPRIGGRLAELFVVFRAENGDTELASR